jgi:hypothetical protein
VAIQRAVLAASVVSACVTSPLAQELGGRIDLEIVSALQIPRFISPRIAFAATEAQCPRDHQTLVISGGRLTQVRLIDPSESAVAFSQATKSAIDDQTYDYRIATANCRIDIAVRQQVRRDGVWISLVASRRRPSVPPQEREEQTPEQKSLTERWMKALQESRAASGLGATAGTISEAFAFNDAPQDCLKAVGEYRIDQHGVLFSFLAPLPGDLNRFVIERVNVDDNHARLYFGHDDCRWQVTVSQSLNRDDRWIDLPLASPSPAK